MKVTEHIENAKGKTLFSFEIIPPVKGKSIQELYDNIDPLMEFEPPFIDVTTSREEYVYLDRDGLYDKKLTRMRPGTLGICASCFGSICKSSNMTPLETCRVEL